MGVVKSFDLKEKFEEIVDNKYRNLMLYIHQFVESQGTAVGGFVRDTGTDYICFRHCEVVKKNLAALEYRSRKDVVEFSIYWDGDLSEVDRVLKKYNIERNRRENGIGALRLRPYLRTKEEFQKIEHLIKIGLGKFCLNKEVSLYREV